MGIFDFHKIVVTVMETHYKKQKPKNHSIQILQTFS